MKTAEFAKRNFGGLEISEAGCRLETKVGVGFEAVIYKATQSSENKRTIAIKMFPDCHQGKCWRESEIHSRLNHKNVVGYHGRGILEMNGVLEQKVKYPYIAMDFANRGSLQDFLCNYPQGLPTREAVSCILQASRGLKNIHDNKARHRDIKPRNILLSRSGNGARVMIADFGISRTDSELSPGKIEGTSYYISPEQIRSQDDFRTDLYSLGIVAYEILIGRLPFSDKKVLDLLESHLYKDPPYFSQVLNGQLDPVKAALEEPIMNALVKDPDERQSACGNIEDWGLDLVDRYNRAVRKNRRIKNCD